MATLTINDLNDLIEENLRQQAQAHGRSMEEEARCILHEALLHNNPDQCETGLGSRIHALFAQVGGVELTLPERSLPRAVDFGDPEQ